MKNIFIFLFALQLMACQSFFKKKESFRIVEITNRNLTKFVEANGSVEAISLVDIISPVPGRLEKLFVKEGDVVAARQQIGLVSSDSRSFFLDMAANKSKKEIEYWKKQIQLTPIVAPTAGKIISLKAVVDDKITGSIAQISKGEIIRANVDEADLPAIKLGQKVVIRFDISSEAKLSGVLEKISETSRLVNNINVYPCEVSLPSEENRNAIPFKLKMGMSVTLRFPVEEKKQVLALPIEVVEGKSLTTINLVKENDQKIKVQLGKIYGNWVEVLSGLESGDKIKIAKFKFDQQKSRNSPLMIKKD